jgi:hypothetical protein
MNQPFEDEYHQWIGGQRMSGTGERRRRLKEGHGHAERLFLQNVWWPEIGHFEFLQAEYEVRDSNDRPRFLDFAYLRFPHALCLEVDGYGTHHRDLDRRGFSDGLDRQNDLVIDDWKVLRFSYDDIKDHPRKCQDTLRRGLDHWYGKGHEDTLLQLPLKMREIIRLAIEKRAPITPREVCARLGVGNRHARYLLQRLSEEGTLLPASGSQRVRSYSLPPVGLK